MSNYIAPEGYIYDDNTGLYYTQIIVEDEQGKLSQIVNWFNPETGEYTQNIYPIKNDNLRIGDEVEYEPETNYDGVEREKFSANRNEKLSSKWMIIGIIAIILVAIIMSVYFALNKKYSESKNERSNTNEILISDSDNMEIDVDDGIADLPVSDDVDIFTNQNEMEPSGEDEYVTDDIFGVYKNDEMVVVVAPGVEHYQAGADGAYDMNASENPDFWIIRYEPESEYIFFGSNVSLDNEVIIDYTENESGHVVDMAYGCMGNEMTYYELVHESGQQRDLLLKKTTEDPVDAYYYYVEMYNEMVK